MNRTTALILAAFFVFCGMPLYWTEDREPIGVANGEYANGCCGSMILRDGVLTFAGDSVRYVVERDKEGRYVLPEHLLLVEDNRLFLERRNYPLKMRLDGSNPPRAIKVWADRSIYEFRRRTP
ncbi:MAG: hypothetical protein JWO81_828 [Alphaproteobacteria bacterium]|nr:hypothetical protein [Alphaproteobacteria bacterium]